MTSTIAHTLEAGGQHLENRAFRTARYRPTGRLNSVPFAVPFDLMSDTFEHASRPGNLGLSVLTFSGLTLLTAQLWQIIPGIVLLVLIPALFVSFCQMIVTPVYGLRVTPKSWAIFDRKSETTIPLGQIAFLRICEHGKKDTRIGLMLTNGREIPVPPKAAPDTFVLIREATARGIPVRHS